MEIRQLKIFRDLAYEKNFVEVAHRNFLTQPSISMHLKHLEEDLGVRLFNRAPKKVFLTKEGEMLLPHVEEILSKCDHIKSLTAGKKNTQQGDVRVATVPSIGIYELSASMKKFMTAFPDVKIHLQYISSEMIYELLLKNKIDLGIVAYPEERTRIQVTFYAKDHMVLIVPPTHRLAKKKQIKLTDIRNERFIAFDKGIPTRTAIDNILSSKGIQVAVRSTNENIDTLKRAVEAGLGVSLLPCKTVRDGNCPVRC